MRPNAMTSVKLKPLCCDVCTVFLFNVSVLCGVFVMVLCSDPETAEYGAARRWGSQYFYWRGWDEGGAGPKSRQFHYLP